MKKRILIIEDNESIANLERRHLEKDGFSVRIAASGEEGLNLINNGDRPDLLIIDYKLPDMSGVDLMQKLKERDVFVPSIILTAAGNEQVAVSAMRLGAMDYIVKDRDTIKHLPASCREVLKRMNLERENEKLIEELRQVNAELIEANKQLAELSKRDELTDLYNRRYLMESLEYEISRSKRYRTLLCIAIFDLDNFKEVNDTYGHSTGDMVLKQIASLMKERFRKTDVLGRYGGEEFIVIFTETSLDSAMFLCEEIRELVSRYPFGYEHSPISLTVSAGVSCLTRRMDVREIIDVADKSLYASKRNGRNRVSALQLEEKRKVQD